MLMNVSHSGSPQTPSQISAAFALHAKADPPYLHAQVQTQESPTTTAQVDIQSAQRVRFQGGEESIIPLEDQHVPFIGQGSVGMEQSMTALFSLHVQVWKSLHAEFGRLDSSVPCSHTQKSYPQMGSFISEGESDARTCVFELLTSKDTKANSFLYQVLILIFWMSFPTFPHPSRRDQEREGFFPSV